MVFEPTDPKQVEWLEQQARRATEWYERYGRALESHANSSGIQALMNYASSPAVQERLRYADRILNSSDFRLYVERIETMTEIAERQFGAGRLALAERGALAHLQRSPGALRAATEHIRRAGPDKVLDEALELATSPEARETLEDMDKEVLVATAEVEIQAARNEGRLDTDTGLRPSELSREQLVTRVLLMQVLEVLSAKLMGAIALSSPLGSLQQLQNTVASLYVFLKISREDENADL